MRRPKLAMQFAERERIRAVAAQEYTVRGRILTQGIGQFHHEILFPVTYYEKPTIFAGAIELDEGQEAVFEQFPFAEFGVTRWNYYQGSAAENANYYTGVHVAIRVSGTTDQTAWVPYKIEGKALSSLNVEDDTGG